MGILLQFQKFNVGGAMSKKPKTEIIVNSAGDSFYYKDGKLHREDGPAITYCNGNVFYYKNGILHRNNGPAVIFSCGVAQYYKNGIRCVDDGNKFVCYYNFFNKDKEG